MTQVLDEAVEWLEATLPDYSPEQLVLKLKEEAGEFIDEPSLEEAADCYLVLAYWARKAHGSHELLAEAIAAKTHKNRSRTWERMPDGTYHHV